MDTPTCHNAWFPRTKK